MNKPGWIILAVIAVFIGAGELRAQDIKKTVTPPKDLEDRLQNISNPFSTKLPIEDIGPMFDLPTAPENQSGAMRSTPRTEKQKGELPEDEESAEEEEDIEKPEIKEVSPQPAGQQSGQQTGPGTMTPPPPPKPPEAPPQEIVPLPSVNITGLVWDSDRPQAIIDGLVVSIGDTVKGIEVTDINKTGVIGTFHGQPVTLTSQRSP